MANVVNKRTLHDGSKRTVTHVYIRGDGTGEETNNLIVDVSALSPSATKVSIECVKAFADGCSAYLSWDATTDVEAAVIPEGHSERNYFVDAELLTNNAGAGVTGDILLTTVGLITGSTLELVIITRK